jgi:hypothetical protein
MMNSVIAAWAPLALTIPLLVPGLIIRYHLLLIVAAVEQSLIIAIIASANQSLIIIAAIMFGIMVVNSAMAAMAAR